MFQTSLSLRHGLENLLNYTLLNPDILHVNNTGLKKMLNALLYYLNRNIAAPEKKAA